MIPSDALLVALVHTHPVEAVSEEGFRFSEADIACGMHHSAEMYVADPSMTLWKYDKSSTKTVSIGTFSKDYMYRWDAMTSTSAFIGQLQDRNKEHIENDNCVHCALA